VQKSMEKRGRKGQSNAKKLRKTVVLINFNTHGKLSDPIQLENLMTELRMKGAAAAALQETRWKEDTDISIPGLGRIINIASKSENDHKKYGMAFYISPEWEPRYMGVKYISDRIAIIQFRVLENSERPLIFINVYGPTQRYTRVGDTAEVEEFFSQLTQVVQREKTRASILVVGGDLNAKIGQMKEEDVEIMGRYTKGYRNEHGKYLAEFLHETKLFLCNTAFKHRDHHIATWHGVHVTIGEDGKEKRRGLHNQIDYLAIMQRHKGMVTNSRSYQSVEFESDHSMVVTELRIKAIYPISQTRIAREPQRELSELYWNPEVRHLYQDNLMCIHERAWKNRTAAAEFMGESINNISINEKQKILSVAMKEAIDSSVPLAPKKIGGRVVYDRDPILKSMSEWRKKLWRTFTNSSAGDATRRAAFFRRKVVFKAMKKRIKELNSARIDRIAEELEASSGNGSNRAMYEYARLMKKKQFIRFSIVDKNGFEQVNSENILGPLREYYQAKFNQEGIEMLEPWSGEPRQLNNPITEEQVDAAIGKLSGNRGAGPDGKKAEEYKAGGALISRDLANEFNVIFQKHEKMDALCEGILIPMNKPKEPHTLQKTRPIVLFNVVRKILCIIARERALEKIESYISQSQHGYRARRSTTEIAWTAQWTRATVERYKEGYLAINTDMSEAFDRAYRDLLMQILERDVGLDGDELRIIRVLLSGITLRIRVGGKLGEPFFTMKGVPQGDGISPTLYNVYSEYVGREYKKVCEKKMRELDIKSQYADDENYLLHIRSLGVFGPCNAECRCHRCQLDEIMWRLPIVMREANMIMNPGKTKICLLERKIKKDRQLTSMNYVGSNINSTMELGIRLAKGLGALLGMTKIWLKGNPISLKTKLRLYAVTVLPHLLYNIHTAALTAAEVERLNVAHRRHLRKVMGIYWPNVLGVRATYASSGVRPISIDIVKRRWQFLGHILRGSTLAPAYRSMEIYYKKRIPAESNEQITTARIQYIGKPFRSIPQMLQEEFKGLSLAKRLELTGGALRGITSVTEWKDIQRLREIANDVTEQHGGKWRTLVAAIVDQAGSDWKKSERKRYRTRRQRRQKQQDRRDAREAVPDPVEPAEPVAPVLWPIFQPRVRAAAEPARRARQAPIR